LEIACGTGQHAAHFAEHVGELAHWIPTDVSDELFWSVRAYCAGLPNVDAPRVLDACKGTEAGDPWSLPPSSVDVVVNINMVTINFAAYVLFTNQTMRTSPLNSNFLWFGWTGAHHGLASDGGVNAQVSAQNCIKMMIYHPFQGLFAGCGHVLKPGGRLFCYGPFKGLNFRRRVELLLAITLLLRLYFAL
jgi:SAM-dependent methyltransferase